MVRAEPPQALALPADEGRELQLSRALAFSGAGLPPRGSVSLGADAEDGTGAVLENETNKQNDIP